MAGVDIHATTRLRRSYAMPSVFGPQFRDAEAIDTVGRSDEKSRAQQQLFLSRQSMLLKLFPSRGTTNIINI